MVSAELWCARRAVNYTWRGGRCETRVVCVRLLRRERRALVGVAAAHLQFTRLK